MDILDCHYLVVKMGQSCTVSGAIVIFLIGYIVFQLIYNIFFHPLAQFPGPFLARSTLLWRMYHSMRGHFHLVIQKQHERYGSVFRVSPNELSFSSFRSWKDIYGHATSGKPILIKSEFYDMYGAAFESLCIGSERDPTNHSRMKKSLSAAFSMKALAKQENIMQRCVNQFVTRIERDGASKQGLNMTKWFEMISFDILGEMAFGESFGCVENGKSSAWSDMIVQHLFYITVLDNLRRIPFCAALGKILLPWMTVEVRDRHAKYSREKVARRLNSESDRHDFLTNISEKVKAGELSQEEMTAHASTLVIAGGETIATFFAGVTYFLLKNPKAYKKLQDEIRTRFISLDSITATLAMQLPYLQAVISEGLRIYQPGSQGFPRLSPGAIIDGYWVSKGTEVYTSAWTVLHDEKNFHEPYTFKPERWLDPGCTDNLSASQPFSLGPRGCLGKNFAYFEMSLILAKMHFQCDLELVDPKLDWLKDSYLHVMWWKPALYIRFKPVNGRI